MTSIPLYSRVLLSESGFTGEASLEVPSGYTVVVRDIDVVAGISVGIAAWAYGTDGAKFWGVNFGTVTSDFTTQSWRGRQVVPGPGYFYISTSAACDIRASGYLLSGVAP